MNYDAWGPLAALIGEWEGTDGLDVSFNNQKQTVHETRFRERVTMEALGPVENGAQRLYGLDYRMVAVPLGGENPFHTEVGYWLWDAGTGHVMRCFMVPRGSVLIAGGAATADATTFTLEANVGSETYGVLSNPYLASKARTTKYTCAVSIRDGVFSYESCTTLAHAAGGEIAHTDRNTLRRVR